jgi:hypothetical protein
LQSGWQKSRLSMRSASRKSSVASILAKGAITLMLVSLALWTALPFRRLALSHLSVPTLGWDAASHALVALDFADSLRLLHVGHFLGVILAQHWWPPFHGLVLSAAFLLWERSLASASLLSFLCYVAMPVTGWLLLQRVFPSNAFALWTAVATALLFLRSPMLVEMSSWSMLESLGGFLGLVGWLAFARREDARWRRSAYLIGTALFFTKYHYGFFLISTFLVCTVIEDGADARRRLWITLRPWLTSRVAKTYACAALFFIVLRLLAEWHGFRKSEIVFLPTVPNVLYAGLVVAVASGLCWRSSTARIWQACTPRVREICCCTVAPITLWLLIPANLRAWYRQTFQASGHRAGLLEQVRAACTFVRNDYVFSEPALLFVVLGLALAIATCRRRKILCGMAAYSVWPILLMSLNRFPLEARFFGCLAPTLLVTSIAGWVQAFGSRKRVGAQIGAWFLLALMGAVYLREERRWEEALQQRATYRYPYPKEETEFVARMIALSDGESPIVISLPADAWVTPTIRLGLRLMAKNRAPEDIVVAKAPLGELLGRNRRLSSRGILVVCEDSAENRDVLRESFSGKPLQMIAGPRLPIAGMRPRRMIFARL